ncbi:NTF2-like domain containing protein [Parasponia andersonii]|uniref:NTF2-like domain containing protein n=1 Tax=Parasponia andersonii TaxID=3476 RepID=A0A2P5DSP8_PARAD|nr:NTF2-like domain containing protein [Parasponia andersonii]
MASKDIWVDKYRYLLNGDGEKDTKWKFGAPPNYDVVNELFEEGRTKIWPEGSLGEQVQNLVKSWEMEIFHKVDVNDYKTLDPKKYTFSLNGREPITLEEIGKRFGGGYIPLLQTSMPEDLRGYDPYKETRESSHKAFTTTFPRGFALEVLEVYSGPPVIIYKFRHWGFMEGPFQGHAPTGEKVQFYGMAIFKMDEHYKVVSVEFFYDPGELIGGLLKGAKLDTYDHEAFKAGSSCPVLRNTG